MVNTIHVESPSTVHSQLQVIRDAYFDDLDLRPDILNGLEKLLLKIAPGTEFENRLIPMLTGFATLSDNNTLYSHIHTGLNNLIDDIFPEELGCSDLEVSAGKFDPAIAEKIIVNSRYKTSELVKEFGISYNTLSVYRKQGIPDTPKTCSQLRYLAWFARRGYDPCDITSSPLSIIVSTSSNDVSLIDSNMLKNIRLEEGYTQERVVKEMGTGSVGQVSNFEKGVFPKDVMRAITFGQYLVWYAKHGYNPLGIKYERLNRKKD